jgi:iron complex outermembrane receptor protein
LGGVILLSPQLLKTTGQNASISSVFGSFGILKNSLNFALNEKKSSLNISYHKLETDGWRQNSAYHREGSTIVGALFKKQNSKLTYFSNYTYVKAYIPSSISKVVYETNPQLAAPTWAASKGY